MDLEEARKIWRGSDMSDEELVEWVRLVNQRSRELVLDNPMWLDKGSPLDKEHKGETIEITKENA